MTSRERVLLTLDHKEPDRVPFNLALTMDIYHRLRKHLGLPPEADKVEGHWTDVSPSIDLLDAMQVDIYRFGLNPPANWRQPDKGDGFRYDEWNVGWTKISRDDGSYYYEMVTHPLAGASIEDVEAFPWPDPHDPGRIAGLREKVERIKRETDKAIMAKFSNSIWEQSWWLYGMEDWLADLLIKPEVPCAIMDKVCDLAIQFARVGIEEVGDIVDILRLSGEDLGTQVAPMISPRLYRKLVHPRFLRYWTEVKQLFLEKNPNGKLMLHSCGNVRKRATIYPGLDRLGSGHPRPNSTSRQGNGAGGVEGGFWKSARFSWRD